MLDQEMLETEVQVQQAQLMEHQQQEQVVVELVVEIVLEMVLMVVVMEILGQEVQVQ
jgi:hypothetical protein